MFVKIHKSYREVIAICDSNLIGKTFEEEKFQLDVKESFFKGKEVDQETLIEIMRARAMEDSTFNIIGKESIETAIKAGIITKESVKKVQDIPFSLLLL
jgi:uncharacterized protein